MICLFYEDLEIKFNFELDFSVLEGKEVVLVDVFFKFDSMVIEVELKLFSFIKLEWKKKKFFSEFFSLFFFEELGDG